MKYKVLLTGKNNAAIDEFFTKCITALSVRQRPSAMKI